ncbi:MAG: hypothetical protein LBE49_06670 [Deltaproteobacteria bacterium]|jgi:hypothetical protein|nr:hypothetical protein [Deltaproteobacteria bacterium]
MYLSKIDLIKDKAYRYNTLPFMKDTSISISFMLTYLSNSLDKDLIILFNEADYLIGNGLISFLGQIRDSYLSSDREKAFLKTFPKTFPRSVALVGMRNIKDYRTQARAEQARAEQASAEQASAEQARAETKSKGPASPFNIIKKALILPNFTSDEIKALYNQHTEASGQVFEPSAIERAWYWSEGQPWLVNALAFEAVTEILKNQYSEPVTGPIIDLAAGALIKRRDTHIDYLLERLREPRVIPGFGRD